MVRHRLGCHARCMPGPHCPRVGEPPSARDVRRALSVPVCAVAAIAVCACPAPVHPIASTVVGDEIMLYRDRAVVLHRFELTAPSAGATELALQLPAGLEASDAVIVDRGELSDAALRAAPPGIELEAT